MGAELEVSLLKVYEWHASASHFMGGLQTNPAVLEISSHGSQYLSFDDVLGHVIDRLTSALPYAPGRQRNFILTCVPRLTSRIF